MSIVNRRNAVIGWATWKVGKHVARRKARQAVPAVEEGRPNKPAIAAAGAAALASLLLWRKLRRRGHATVPDTGREADTE